MIKFIILQSEPGRDILLRNTLNDLDKIGIKSIYFTSNLISSFGLIYNVVKNSISTYSASISLLAESFKSTDAIKFKSNSEFVHCVDVFNKSKNEVSILLD